MNWKYFALSCLQWQHTMGIDFTIADNNQMTDKNKLEVITIYNKDITLNQGSLQELRNNDEQPLSESQNLANNCSSLEELKSIVLSFEGCELKKLATNTVFSDGVSNAPIMLIGEAPGQNEDKQGIPFCGESGKLLDNMLNAIGLSRKKNVYITNTIFWRPPANRRPTTEEVSMCQPFVEKHIAFINPKLIILVGSTAATSLLGDHVKITKIRQEYYLYRNKYLKQEIPITAIFHPAYLLRQPQQKKASWYDLLRIKQFIESNEINIL